MQVIVRGPVPVPGPEDIVVDHAAAVAFSASQQRKSATGKLLGPADMPSGAIFALDLASEPLAKRLLIDQESLGFPFHPRGCSLFSGPVSCPRFLWTPYCPEKLEDRQHGR